MKTPPDSRQKMNILAAAIFTIGIVLFGSPAAAKHPDDTADYLCKTCAGDADDAIFCLGYIRGAINALDGEAEASAAKQVYCIPPATSLNDIKLIWDKYCDNHPKDHKFRASSVLAVALAHAYPCPADNENQAGH
jgi:hypothetical protein